MIRDVPLDMRPYALILGTHRQPDKGIDKLLHIDDANHIVIISNNHVSSNQPLHRKRLKSEIITII